MYQKKEKNILQKMSPHLSQLDVAMLIEIILGEIIANPQIGNIYKDWRSLF